MKYWRGYIAAAILAAATWGMMQFAEAHSALLDMVYPYVTRLIQDFLAGWSSGVDFCLWQLAAVLLGVLLLASIVVMIILRWNVIQWFGWVLASAAALFCLHTGLYGMNQYCSSLAEDIRLTVQTGYTVTELAEATTYFRDMANALSTQVARNADGSVAEQDFDTLALQAGDGFESLTYDSYYAVFAGSTEPVKKLGWADLYTSMGISGVTMALTGEAAVNPQTPTVALPFTMCHEMAHRMCIAQERDANLAAYLACTANSDPLYQYSGYFMAFRYCYNALATVTTSTAIAARQEIYAGIGEELMQDLTDYREYYSSVQDTQAVSVASTVNDTYIKVSGDESGINSYGEVTDLLVSWHIQNIWDPAHADTEDDAGFDPLDKSQVDLG